MDEQPAHRDPTPAEEGKPGKTRTWWHPLLVQMLNFVLSGAYEVIGELVVGKVPLSVDIFLVQRSDGRLSELAEREAGVLISLLRRYSFVEFKGPTDAMVKGDVSRLFACMLLWFGQQEELPDRNEVTMIFIAPTLNGPAKDELKALGCESVQVLPGVYRIDGYPFTAWFLETDNLADREAVLALVSRVFLKDRRGTIERYAASHGKLLYFMLQQVQQFADREEFLMQFADTETVDEVEAELKAAVLSNMTVEERLQGLGPEERLQGLGPEERLQGLGPEERLQGLDPKVRLQGLDIEDVLGGLSDEQIAALRDRFRNEGNGN